MKIKLPDRYAVAYNRLLEEVSGRVKEFSEKRLSIQSEAEQLRYLPQSVKLEEAVNPHLARMTMLYISTTILIFVLWTAMAHVSEIARATGEVVPRGFVQVVQHLDGGIVTEILTGEGDLVRKDDVLLRIDDGSTKQDLAKARAMQRFLEIEAERLRAFIANEEPNFAQFAIPEASEQTPMDVGQAELLHDLETKKMLERADKLKKNLQIAKEALTLQKDMHKQGLVPKMAVLQYENDVNKIEAEAHRELASIESQIAQNREVVSKLQNKLNRLEVRSPVYGLIKGLQVNTIGGVIEPGKTLMEIVPLDKHLVVDTRIQPKDIGHVQVGQSVKVIVSSYDFARYGAASGKLEFLSATTFIDDSGKPYYRGRVALSDNHVGNDPIKNPILPGMTVEADIVTGEKTILSYLLKPIHLSLKTAFTER